MGSLRIIINKIKDNPYLLLIPAVVFITIFYITPNIMNYYYSFTDWSNFKEEINFVGLTNFKELFLQGDIFRYIFNTLEYAVFVAIMMNVVGLTLACALEKTSNVNSLFRAAFFLPILVSPIAAVYLFIAIYSPNGPINQLLGFLTGREINFGFLSSQTWTLFFITIIHAWKWFPITMVVYIAGLNAIPEDLIESAKIEGASYWKIFTKIKLPLLGPALTFNIVITLIGSLSAFEIVMPIRGGPGGATTVLNYFVYLKYSTGNLGGTVAVSAVMLMLIVGLAIPFVLFLRSREVEL